MPSFQGMPFFRGVFALAVLAHIITAWFSVGYHSEDEHHQVIGFAQAWSGELPVGEHAWEYHARIRPSLLPWIAVGVFKACEALGIQDPFTKSFVLRLLTALLALLAVNRFVRTVRGQLVVEFQKPFAVVSYFLWFLPFLHVRFSSETWSGLLVLMSLTAVLNDARGRWWAFHAGALMAVAVWIRPPVATIAMGLFLWMAFVRKDAWRDLLGLLGAACIVIILGAAIDSSFYGTWTFSLLRFTQMGIAGHPDHVFDILPWYYYAPWVVKYAIPPIGMCILAALLLLLWKRPRHVLVWCVLPFLLMHALIPHKEPRFLYPVADLTPLLLMLGWQTLVRMNAKGWIGAIRKPIGYALIIVLAGCNAMGLAVIGSSPAGNGRVRLAQAIGDLPTTSYVRIAYLIDPYDSWRIRLPHFYRPIGSTDTLIDPATTAAPVVADLLIARSSEFRHIHGPKTERSRAITSSERMWTVPLLRLYTWGDWQEPWMLYNLRRAE